jgi:hypothetical protein
MNDYSHPVISPEAKGFMAICLDASARSCIGMPESAANFLGKVSAKELV